MTRIWRVTLAHADVAARTPVSYNMHTQITDEAAARRVYAATWRDCAEHPERYRTTIAGGFRVPCVGVYLEYTDIRWHDEACWLADNTSTPTPQRRA